MDKLVHTVHTLIWMEDGLITNIEYFRSRPEMIEFLKRTYGKKAKEIFENLRETRSYSEYAGIDLKYHKGKMNYIDLF